ncbi:MAG TPA: L,D-transpeptidase family protein [Beijerinckiaceae bacterium]|jgi:L,D-peptidoglycan transpeptidase YkuD (ErfK/YbiS/YcfS/YnhG family)
MARRPPKPPKRTTLDVVTVHRSPLDRRRGRIVAGPLVLPCALGRSGPTRDKREGDGATPVGRFRALQAFYRADRVRRPRARLPLAPIRADDGWCDDPRDRNYNRPVRLPYPAGHERMARDDGLYDVVLDLAWNRGPVRKGRGSAIFLHCARPGFTPTEGCVAIDPNAIARLLARIGPRTMVEVGGRPSPRRK